MIVANSVYVVLLYGRNGLPNCVLKPVVGYDLNFKNIY